MTFSKSRKTQSSPKVPLTVKSKSKGKPPTRKKDLPKTKLLTSLDRLVETQWLTQIDVAIELLKHYGHHEWTAKQLKELNGYGTNPSVWGKSIRSILSNASSSMNQKESVVMTTTQRKFDPEINVINNLDIFETGIPIIPISCKYCGPGTRIVSFQRQIKRSDEGMTTFYVCMKCQNQWRAH